MARRELLILGGLTLAAAAVRFATLDVQSFHHDEAVTAGRVILPDLGDTLSVVGSSERSPPLYYVVAWGWAKLFGTGEVGLRSLSALAGTLTVPAAFLAGRELAAHGRSAVRIGLVAAALVAFNPYLVWYSQEARSYAFMVLFGALGLAWFARSAREPTGRNLALWAAASAAALLSHYFAAFLIVPEAAWLAWAVAAERRRVLITVAAVAAVGCALIPLAGSQEGGDRRNGFTDTPLVERAGEVGLDYVASEEPDPLAGSSRVDTIQLGSAGGGTLLLALSVWLVARRGTHEERHGAALAAGLATVVIGAPLVLAVAGVDFVNPRNLVAGAVPLLCVAAIGFGGQRAWALGRAAAVAACAMFAAVVVAVNISEEMQRENWRGAAEAMGPASDARIVVTNANGDDPLAYYLGAQKFEGRAYRHGARVSEILTLSTAFTVTPPQGFRLASEQGLAPLFILRRFVSSRPRLVRPGDVEGEKVLSERSAALIDEP